MAKGKKTKAAKGGNREMLVKASLVKEAIKAADCNTSGDAITGLNDWIYWLIQQATARAKANNRKTVRPHDFMVN